MKITEDLVKEREMIISSLEAELTSYKNEASYYSVPCVLRRGAFSFLVFPRQQKERRVQCQGKHDAAENKQEHDVSTTEY